MFIICTIESRSFAMTFVPIEWTMAFTHRAIVTKCNRLQCIAALYLCLQNIFTARSMPSEHLQTLSICVIVVIVFQQWPIFGGSDSIKIERISITHLKKQKRNQKSKFLFNLFTFAFSYCPTTLKHFTRTELTACDCSFHKVPMRMLVMFMFSFVNSIRKKWTFAFFSFAKWSFFGGTWLALHYLRQNENCGRCKYIQLKLRRWHLFSFHSFVRRFVDVEKTTREILTTL